MIWIIAGLLLFIFQVALIVILEFRHPAKSVAWIMILFVFPIIGFIVYYFFAQEYKKQKLVQKMPQLEEKLRILEYGRLSDINAHDGPECMMPLLSNGHEDQLFSLLQRIPGAPILKGNVTEVLTNGDVTFRSLLSAMETAKDHIHVEFYILRDDELGQEFQRLWIRKAQEGVKVRVVYDGIGSLELKASFLKKLTEGGVEVRSFLPPFIAFFDKRINYRNHRKIVVVDGSIGFLGGLNVGDEYLGKDERLGFWRDTHIRIEGPAVLDLQRVFLTDWTFVCGPLQLSEQLFPEVPNYGGSIVQIVPSGPDMERELILEIYFSAITAAKKRVYITTPYFIPDSGLTMALKTAARSGVDVRIIIPGKPDYRLVHLATLSYVGELLDAGVRFYEYQRGFMHAKTLIVDEILASVGTANMDMRSFFSNFELNAFLYDIASIRRLEHDFNVDLQHSSELTLESYSHRPRMQKGKEVLARLISPLL